LRISVKLVGNDLLNLSGADLSRVLSEDFLDALPAIGTGSLRERLEEAA
jgi:hypothetical protein